MSQKLSTGHCSRTRFLHLKVVHFHLFCSYILLGPHSVRSPSTVRILHPQSVHRPHTPSAVRPPSAYSIRSPSIVRISVRSPSTIRILRPSVWTVRKIGPTGSVSLAIQTNPILLFPTDDWEGELEAWGLRQAWSTLHIWNRFW